MICPKCNKQNEQGARFCSQCGTSLESVLPDNTKNTIPSTLPEIQSEEAQDKNAHESASDTVDFKQLQASSSATPDNSSVPHSANNSTPHNAVNSESDNTSVVTPNNTPENDEAYKGLEHNTYDDTPLVTPWEKGATMKMKPLSDKEKKKANKQQTFVSNTGDTKPHKSKKPVIIALVLLLIAGSIACVTWYFEMWGGYKIPDVVGMSQGSATNVLSEKGFTVRIEHVKSDDEEGVVLLTDPQAGSRLSQGSEIVLHVAVSRSMPSLVGLSKEDAQAKLTKEGFTNVTFDTEKSNETEDTVLSATPDADTKIKASYPIHVVLAQPYRVPDVVGKTQDEATSLLEEEGYSVSVKRTYTETATEGTVLSSDPIADEKLNSGETVTISVATSRERELVNAAQSAFAQGTQHTVAGVSYEVSSLTSVTYQGNDTTTVAVMARAYTVLLGVTVYLDPASYTWSVSWTSDNQIASLS